MTASFRAGWGDFRRCVRIVPPRVLLVLYWLLERELGDVYR